MTANEFCSLQHCRNYGCSKLNRDKDLCTQVNPPAKPSQVRRGIDCTMQTPRWSIKDCREKKCDFLGTEELINGGRCCLFGKNSIMPGTLTRCLQDPEMPPEELLDKIPLPPIPGEKEEDSRWQPRKSPGIKNCPELCPYKLIEEVDGSGKRKIRKGTCAFCGETLGGGCGVCHTTILDGGDLMKAQIGLIGAAFERREHPPSSETCGGYCCPDGVYRCEKGETSCPLIKVPFADLPDCPLWRIPSKLLPAQVAQISEKSGEPAESVPDSGQEEKTSSRKSAQKEKNSPRALTQKEKPAEPEKAPAPEKKRKKPASDVPALNVLYLEDCESLTKRMEPESIDLIFTDPPYVTEPIDDDGVTQWERAYVALHLIASKVLKPSGFLITYAPQAHLHDIMDILAHGSSMHIMVKETGGQLDYFWIIPSLNGGATCKAHKWNALCLHKPILVYQKAPFKSPSKCFADVVRGKKQKSYHAWQQSVHDVLGIISRFMEPGQVLYDPYACTATTLIAGQILGMQWIGAEIDPKAHAIGVRELQQRPMDLFAFGGEMPEPVVRETIEAPKDTSRQGVFEIDENSSKKRSRIDKPESGIKTEPADPATEARAVELHAACLDCEAMDRCMRHDPHANCLQEFLDFEKAVEEGREEDKIPNITWCSTIRNCPSVDWEGGICTKTGNLVKDQTYCPTQHLINEERKRKAETSPLFVRWCGNCGHHKARKTFHESCPRLPDLMFKGGKLSADQLMNETACEKKCGDWFPKEQEKKKETTQGPSEKKVTTHYYSGKDLSPSLGTCPDKCAYKDAEKSSCRFMDQQFLRMESCPIGVLQGDETGQKCQLENIARALARLSANLPSKERCQCNPCPDGVQRCGVSDEACPFSKNSFEDLALCPMQNPRRVRQIRREHPVRFVSIEDWKKDQEDQPPQEQPNCGGKRPAISRCPDNCPDRSIEKEGGYPQGRCKVTGEKLREMQACPHDPPAPEKKPRSSKRTKTLVAKTSECHDPLRKFLNEHYEQITTGKDLPIVPHVVEQYKRFDDQERRVKLFIGTSTSPGQWWTLSPSGKLRKVSKRTGEHCQGEVFPDCKFSFEWHYDNKKED